MAQDGTPRPARWKGAKEAMPLRLRACPGQSRTPSACPIGQSLVMWPCLAARESGKVVCVPSPLLLSSRGSSRWLWARRGNAGGSRLWVLNYGSKGPFFKHSHTHGFWVDRSRGHHLSTHYQGPGRPVRRLPMSCKSATTVAWTTFLGGSRVVAGLRGSEGGIEGRDGGPGAESKKRETLSVAVGFRLKRLGSPSETSSFHPTLYHEADPSSQTQRPSSKKEWARSLQRQAWSPTDIS